MGALGVIAEYNPFHNGHYFHLQEARRLTGRTHIVAVMSGHFVQRGEPALCDKWTRTRMALENGVHIVIELPVYFATSGADHFARAAVRLLHASGIVDCLCFGSEAGDLTAIAGTGRRLAAETPEFKMAIKKQLALGQSFAAARAAAVQSIINPWPGGIADDILSQPNNILGVEYCKALVQLGSSLTAHTIRRAAGEIYQSARQIRQSVKNGQRSMVKKVMPPSSYALLEKADDAGEIADLDRYGDILQYLLRTLSGETLKKAADMTEGLENRFRNQCGAVQSLSELLSAVKTKRYAYTRLQRAALHVILGLESEAMSDFEAEGGPPYIRVLGFRKDSAFLLSELQQKASLPVITNLKHAPTLLTETGRRMLSKEAAVGDLYPLARKKNMCPPRWEYRMPLVMI